MPLLLLLLMLPLLLLMMLQLLQKTETCVGPEADQSMTTQLREKTS